MYIKIINGNEITEKRNSVNWFKDQAGKIKLTDFELTKYGWYKVIDNEPSYNFISQTLTEKDFKDWDITAVTGKLDIKDLSGCYESAIFYKSIGLYKDISIQPNEKYFKLVNGKYERILETEDPNEEIFQEYVKDIKIGDDFLVRKTYNVIDKDLEVIREERKQELKYLRKQYEFSGINYNLNGTTIQISTTAESVRKLTAIFVAITNSIRPEDSKFKTMDKGYLIINNADTKLICETVLGFVGECYNKESEYLDLINSATTIQDLISINFNIGWSTNAIFGA